MGGSSGPIACQRGRGECEGGDPSWPATDVGNFKDKDKDKDKDRGQGTGDRIVDYILISSDLDKIPCNEKSFPFYSQNSCYIVLTSLELL